MYLLAFIVLISWFAAGAVPRASAAEIGQSTLRFFDECRQRPIVAEIWYPTADAPTTKDRSVSSLVVRSPTVRNGSIGRERRPLILCSHGTGGSRLALEWLATGLARHGYIVAAVDHWGNTSDNPVPEYFLKPWERSQDLSVALSKLMWEPKFGPIIDRERIGAIGFSLGGYTVLALAGGVMDLDALYRFSTTEEGRRETEIPEFPKLFQFMHEPATKERVYAAFHRAPLLRDTRVKAVVALAPAIGQAFTTSAQFAHAHAPVLIVGAEGDRLAPVPTNASHYHDLLAGSRLVILRGEVGHYVFLNEGGEEMKGRLPELFVDRPSCQRSEIHDEVICLAADFFSEHLRARTP